MSSLLGSSGQLDLGGIHFVHEAVTAKHLKLNKVDSKLNGADILTKPPNDKNLFLELRHRLMGYQAPASLSQEVEGY